MAKIHRTPISMARAREKDRDLLAAAPACRVCGCTDEKACEGGCFWVEPDLCSAHAPEAAARMLEEVKRGPCE